MKFRCLSLKKDKLKIIYAVNVNYTDTFILYQDFISKYRAIMLKYDFELFPESPTNGQT